MCYNWERVGGKENIEESESDNGERVVGNSGDSVLEG